MCLILVPAAGASTRMGGADKLLRPIGGAPILTRQVMRALASGLPVLVTLPPDRPARAQALPAHPGLTTAMLPDAAAGMSRSLRAGARAALDRGLDLLVLLPDMPDIDTSDILRLVAARGDAPIARATTEDGTPGHPVLFDRDLLGQFEDLGGDRGAAPVIAAYRDRVRAVPLKGRRACRDLDTPADWAAYLSERT